MTFRRFFLVRLAWSLLGAWLVTVLTFTLFFVVPERPDRLFAGPQATAAQVATVEEAIGTGDSLHERYASFLHRFFADEPVAAPRLFATGPTRSAIEAASATAALVVPGLALSLALGVAAGLALSARRGPSRLARVPIYVAVSLFPIWVALWLLVLFGDKLALLPPGGYCDVFAPPKGAECGGATDWAEALILPWIIFAIPFTAIYARVISHIARDDRRRSLLLLGRMLGRDIGYFIGFSLFLEVVFGIPGLGGQMLFALEGFATEWVMSAFLLASLVAIAWHFVIDMIVCALDEDLRAAWPVAAIRNPA